MTMNLCQVHNHRTLGKAVLVDTDLEFSLFVSVALIRFDHTSVNPFYSRIVLNSPLALDEFNRIKVGGGTHTNKLNLGDLHTVAFPLPPLAEQRRIVERVDELMALCDRLETSLGTADDTRNRLLESILHDVLGSTQPENATDNNSGHDVRGPRVYGAGTPRRAHLNLGVSTSDSLTTVTQP